MNLSKQRVLGMLQGVALGDAMGMPTEVMSQQTIKKNHPNGVNGLFPSEKGEPFQRDLPAGSITDDTVNTLLLSKMLIENKGKIEVKKFIHSLIKWTQDSEMSQYVAGPSTMRALSSIRKGTPLAQAGIMGTTNGAAMKISPIGVVYDYHKPDDLVEAVAKICLPTHNTQIAIAGACVVAAIDSYVVRGGTNLKKMWLLANEFAHRGLGYGFDYPSADLIYKIQQAKQIVDNTTQKDILLKRLYSEIGSGMQTIETIPCVLAIIQFTQGDAWETAKMAATIGGDTDTIGSIATGICGGMHPESVPLNLIGRIEKTNKFDLSNISEQLYIAIN